MNDKKYEDMTLEELEAELLVQRNSYDRNNLSQNIMKLKNNSSFGSVNMEINQFSHGKGMSASITTGGRYVNRLANHYMSEKLASLLKVENEGYYKFTAYHHTDSGMIDLSGVVDLVIQKKGETDTEGVLQIIDNICDKILQPEIDRAISDLTFALNAYDDKVWNMEKETLSDGFVAVAPGKNYYRYYKRDGNNKLIPKHKITGLSLTNKSTPPFCKEALNPVLDVILDKDSKGLIQYIDEVKVKFREADLETISPIKGVSSIDYPLPGYKRKNENDKLLTAPLHSRGAIVHNQVVERDGLDFTPIRDGDKVYYAYLNTPNREAMGQNVVSFINPKFMDASNIKKLVDYDTMFDKFFVKNIELITDPIGWSLSVYQELLDEWE